MIFTAFIVPELATEYLAGAVLLGEAPCTAMVFVWSTLTKGDPAYTVVQVATNDLIILFAFVPIVKFLLGVSNVSVPWDTLILSVVLFVVIPLAGGMLTRSLVIRKHGSAGYVQTPQIEKRTKNAIGAHPGQLWNMVMRIMGRAVWYTESL